MGGERKKKQSAKKKQKKRVAGQQAGGEPGAAELPAAAGGAASNELGLVESGSGPPKSPWVKVIVRRGRVKTQEWVAAKIVKEDKERGEVEVEAQGKTLHLKSGQVHWGVTKPTDSTKTAEDADKLRREVAEARGALVSSPVFRGPLPYENAVGMGWLQRDIETTREEVRLSPSNTHARSLSLSL